LTPRRLALLVARARVGLGVGTLALPGTVSRASFGGDGRASRAAARLAGGRDVALGLGAVTCLREQTQDAEWVGMGALVDGMDALVLLFTPRLPTRSRLIGLGAAACAVAGLVAAQRLAEDREPA
jgi:hypothetical protein